MDEELKTIADMLAQLTEDTSVPRNVRNNITNAKNHLENPEFAMGVSSAIYALEEVSNDINLPMHARTLVWNLLSELEAIKESRL
ncbi:UPF0147 family protein [Candidatus Micrarchaeota archaeon]|nr:UPF0147 family protein [Candidatus Micrarchaeota archaeon]